MKVSQNGKTKMRIMMAGALAALTLAVGACERFPDQPGNTTAAKEEPKKPAKPKTVNQPVEDAMMRIPPELRAPYQKAFICEVKRAKTSGKAVEVTPAYVDDLTRRLKEKPSLAEC